MTLAMTVTEREAFLGALHVGVLSVAGEDGRGPLTMPIWYRYEPGGDVTIFTGRNARKMRLLREGVRCSLCAQDEAPPYKYVTVEGPVASVGTDGLAEERRLIARRYLGEEGGDAWCEATAADAANEVVVRIRPERWLSADFSKLG
ncbi:MAG TPA: pyridoxamine 5'-phosphate oxidase family protein [Candidatus Dormibacteraeota bacterium]|jgi:PPOX class probable F420-dependent enzyme